jgi:hypothetical protein
MIDPTMFTAERLVAALLYDMAGNVNAWRKWAEIVPAYMPPYPGDDTRPRCVVRLGGSFLRGGGDTLFWDMYGDDFHTPEHALLALCRAPVPPGLVRMPRAETLPR